jgi:putative peptidoglycan lipid II flippase
VTDTPVRDDGWSTPTHYAGGRPVEPRLFTEADPMASLLMGDWSDGVDESRWGTTTYVGRRRRHAAREDDGRHPETDTGRAGRTDTATVDPQPRPASHEAVDETSRPEDASAESTRGLLANTRSMAVASLASRVTGFLRSILLLAALGTAGVGNAYNSGNNLPNMVYELLLGGVLSSVLIPLLVHAEAEDEDGGLAYTQRLLSIATAALGVMTLLVVAAAPWIAAAFVPAGPQRELTSIFATLLLPEIFFYGLGAMFMAVLNIKNIYRPGAWAPVLNNVVMMATVLVFWIIPGPNTLNPSTMTTPQILVIGIGTTLGIAAQAAVLIPALRRSGFRWEWRFRARPGENDRLREIGSLATWVFAYVVISQVGVSVIQKVGNHNGGFTVFTNADLLFQMPYGILVVSVLTAIMPRLSRAAVRGDTAAVVADLSLGARLSAVALVPITAGLIVLGPVMAVTLFAYGQTSIGGAHLIGSSLAWSAFGLFPFALVMLQLRVFYAMRDGRTPALINAFMVATKVVLILVTNEIYQAPEGTNVDLHPSVRAVQWLNIATSLSYVVGAVIGHVLLTRRLGRLGFRPVVRTVAQVSAASVAGAVAAWVVVELARDRLGGAHAGSAAGLAGGGLAGLAVLVVVLWRMRIADVREVLAAARR